MLSLVGNHIPNWFREQFLSGFQDSVGSRIQSVDRPFAEDGIMVESTLSNGKSILIRYRESERSEEIAGRELQNDKYKPFSLYYSMYLKNQEITSIEPSLLPLKRNKLVIRLANGEKLNAFIVEDDIADAWYNYQHFSRDKVLNQI